MTHKEISAMVDEMGYPSAYRRFEGEPTSTPFIIFYSPETIDLFADGKNYQRVEILNIELYTVRKNFEAERNVEAVLEKYGFSYSKDEQSAGEKEALGIIYTMGVLIDG